MQDFRFGSKGFSREKHGGESPFRPTRSSAAGTGSREGTGRAEISPKGTLSQSRRLGSEQARRGPASTRRFSSLRGRVHGRLHRHAALQRPTAGPGEQHLPATRSVGRWERALRIAARIVASDARAVAMAFRPVSLLSRSSRRVSGDCYWPAACCDRREPRVQGRGGRSRWGSVGERFRRPHQHQSLG